MFYKLGYKTAFEKLGNAGLLSRVGSRIAEGAQTHGVDLLHKVLNPSATHATAAGAVAGGLGGAASGDDYSLGRILGGAALGAAGGYGAGKGLNALYQRGLINPGALRDPAVRAFGAAKGPSNIKRIRPISA